MKKRLLPLLLLGMSASIAFAQTPAAQPVGAAPSAAPTPEQQTQEIAGFIYACATAKPLLGWKTITVSLDRMSAQQWTVSGYATMGNDSVKKLTLCDTQQTAQALIDMLNLTAKGKSVEWQSLLFRTQANRQFEFIPLTAADVAKLTQQANKPAAP